MGKIREPKGPDLCIAPKSFQERLPLAIRVGLIIKHALLGTMLVSLLGGCSLYDRLFGEEEEKSPSELMEEGNKAMEKGKHESATETFQRLKDRYPYSKHAIEAELKMADAFFKREEFPDAYDAYDEFERLHPKNKNIPYVIYQKGMCHFEQITTIDRDQSHTLKAKEEFERLIRKFPREEYAKLARKKIRKCLIYLAEYELYVGHFYFQMGKYRPALARYVYIIKNYPDMGQYHEALEYIGKCKEALAKEDKSKEEKKSSRTNILRRLIPF